VVRDQDVLHLRPGHHKELVLAVFLPRKNKDADKLRHPEQLLFPDDLASSFNRDVDEVLERELPRPCLDRLDLNWA
jgi:hypothetical protein